MQQQVEYSAESLARTKQDIIDIVSSWDYNTLNEEVDGLHFVFAYGNHKQVAVQAKGCPVFMSSVADNLKKQYDLEQDAFSETLEAFDKDLEGSPSDNTKATTAVVVDKEAVFTDREISVICALVKAMQRKAATMPNSGGLDAHLENMRSALDAIKANPKSTKEMVSALEQKYRFAVAMVKGAPSSTSPNPVIKLFSSILTKFSLYRNCKIQ